jgi:hypothetical protein
MAASTEPGYHKVAAGNDEESSSHALYAGAKRRIATLEQRLQDLRNASTKRKLYVQSSACNCLLDVSNITLLVVQEYPFQCHLGPCNLSTGFYVPVY